MIRVFLLSIVLFSLFAPPLWASDALPHQVYVWQRAWSPPVVQAVAQHGSNFQEVVVLAADISCKTKAPQVTRVDVDYPALAKLGQPVGLALRVGPNNGLGTNQVAVQFIADTAASLVAEAKKNKIQPCELQIDFDCATSKLNDYCAWLSVVQKKLAPLPVTITALPTWLNSPSFKPLAAIATNYVLQVHSLEKPTTIDQPFTLCDVEKAKQAVKIAGLLGVPFRVALPTYSYIVAFDSKGNFRGLSADGPRSDWPTGTQLREMAANPQEMASLVHLWATNRPTALQNIIWFRMPVAVDNLNWRWQTLGAIMAGRELHEEIRATTRRVEPGLVEVSLENTGDLDISSRLTIEARWTDARLVAGDALRGFEMSEQGSSGVLFQTKETNFRLPAGESIVIGWLRLDTDREVQLEVKKF